MADVSSPPTLTRLDPDAHLLVVGPGLWQLATSKLSLATGPNVINEQGLSGSQEAGVQRNHTKNLMAEGGDFFFIASRKNGVCGGNRNVSS